MRYWIFVISFLLLPVGAYVALAAPEGLVPCKGAACQACDLIKLGNNIIQFLISFGVLVAVVIVAWAGVKLVTSGGSSEAVGKAKSMIWSALVGFVILLACYLLVDVFMKTLTKDENKKSMGVAEWTAKFCEDTSSKTSTPQTTASGKEDFYFHSERNKITPGVWCFSDNTGYVCSGTHDTCIEVLRKYIQDDQTTARQCYQIPR